MLKSYKIEIKLNDKQKEKVHKTLGTCRFIYNFYLKYNKEIYEKEQRFVSAMSFSKWLNNNFLLFNKEFSWIKEVSSKSVKQSIFNGEKAFKKFFKKQSKFPRFKKKDSKVKMYLPKNNKNDWTLERHRIKIPTLGFVRLKEFGYIPLNSKVKSGTVSRIADRYFVSVLVEEESKKMNPKKKTKAIGIDLGIKEFAVTSEGEFFKNINKTKKIKRLEKKLKKSQRQLSRKFKTKTKGESSRNIYKNKLRVQRLHYRLSNIRVECVRFVVNSLVSLNPKFISIEDLKIKSMLKNKHLSKAIKDQMFYYFREFLTQQCKKYNIELRIIDKWFPSSKTCSKCGSIKRDLKLTDRTYNCKCGFSMDRDLNASINIKNCVKYNTLG